MPVLMLAASCGGAERMPEAAKAAPVAVQTTVAKTQSVAVPFDAGGTVRATNFAVLSSRIMSPIVEVPVKAGDRVRRFQPLVLLDARQLEAGVTSADAMIAAATQAVAAADAEVAAAQSALALASAQHKRIAGLRERNSATPSELDDAVAGLRAAEARLASAQARKIAADRAAEASRGNARAATVSASYAVISAPFDGIVTEKPAEAGSMALPGVPLVTVEDPGSYRLEVSIDATRTAEIKPGLRVPITVAGADEPLEGTIAEITEAMNASTHAFLVKIDLPSTGLLRSGQFGRASLPGGERRQLLVPSSAVLHRGQLSMVFTNDKGTARMRIVHPGQAHDDWTPILAGLVDGDDVIVNPPAGLSDGALVSATPAPGRTR